MSRNSAASTGMLDSPSSSRCSRDSRGPAFCSMWDARWHSQSAKTAAIHSGTTKYMRQDAIRSDSTIGCAAKPAAARRRPALRRLFALGFLAPGFLLRAPFFRRHLRTRAARLGQADRDGLLGALHLLPRLSAL